MDRRAARAALSALAAVWALACGATEIVIGDSPGLARIVAGVVGDSGLGAPEGEALREPLAGPQDVDAAPDGTLYIADTGNRVIREISLLGTERIVAGTPDACTVVVGPVPAAELCLRRPVGVAVLPGSRAIVVADQSGHMVWRVDLEAGAAAPFLGTGVAGRSSFGQVAANAGTREPTDLAVDREGKVFVAETGNNRVVAVGAPEGVGEPKVVSVAGDLPGYGGDGGSAVVARLRAPRGVWWSNGELFIADTQNHVIRQVRSDGRIFTLAGTALSGFSGDGGLAVNAQLATPTRVVVTGDLVLFSDRDNRRVRAVSLKTGLIDTFLGTGTAEPTLDLDDASRTATARPEGLATKQGFIYAADAGHHVVRRVLVP